MRITTPICARAEYCPLNTQRAGQVYFPALLVWPRVDPGLPSRMRQPDRDRAEGTSLSHRLSIFFLKIAAGRLTHSADKRAGKYTCPALCLPSEYAGLRCNVRGRDALLFEGNNGC